MFSQRALGVHLISCLQVQTWCESSRPVPGVATDEEFVLVLAKSLHLNQLALLPHLRPPEQLGGQHLGADRAQPAQAQAPLGHEAAHTGVCAGVLQGAHQPLQGRLLESLEDGRGDRPPLLVVIISRLEPPQPFHKSAASRSENEHGWFSGGPALTQAPPDPITGRRRACHGVCHERHGVCGSSSDPAVHQLWLSLQLHTHSPHTLPPKPDPTLDFSQTMLFPDRHLERMLPIDGIARLPGGQVRAQNQGWTRCREERRNYAASAAAAGRCWRWAAACTAPAAAAVDQSAAAG